MQWPHFSVLAMIAGFWCLPMTTQADTSSRPPYLAIDFSSAGYGGGRDLLPSVPSVLLVRPTGGDDTALLQAALDHVAQLPLQNNGFRGALQLMPGTFHVAGALRLRESGIVLRGSASGGGTTTVTATGQSRRTLIEVGMNQAPLVGETVSVIDDRAPAGSLMLTLASVAGLAVGDRIVITRPSTKEWIMALGMDKAEGSFADQRLHWLPGSRDLIWDRAIAAIDSSKKQITLDAPITTAIEQRFGSGEVAQVVTGGLAQNVGIENLRLESAWDAANPRDEEHAWIGIALDNVEDAWVRGVVARHFAGSTVRIGQRARCITVQECRSEQPISEIGGYRRQSFLVEGQQVLVRGCFAELGLNDFAVGLCAAGPNVFLDCTANRALGPSGSFESWASGVLYERVRINGSGLRLTYDMERSQGGGWTAANSVIWNCQAANIEARGPEDAPNSVQNSPQPLYEAQLAKRISALPQEPPRRTQSIAGLPVFQLKNGAVPVATTPVTHPLQIVNGRFVIDGRVVWGGAVNNAWWKGQVSPAIALKSGGISITRFVPGRIGPGLTEDLPQLAARMVADGTPFHQNGPGLWYDRRRDEHTIVQRADGNVWAPFYEMPWARSGQGTAWDGLSRYDLSKFNPWFFERVREFAQLSDQHGLVFYHNLYNTHNVYETAAHWVDFPWRPANNINDTGLPEPPPLEARNTIHVGNQFYNADHPGRRALHRAYIFHTLDQLASSRNILFGLGFQFSGPLAFQQFFQDTVAEWEKRTGRTVRLALTTSKDITDAILADPVRSRQIAVIDTRYWQYRPDGTLWAPRGDQNLAFREIIGKEFGRGTDAPPDTTPEQTCRQVREYRDRFPDKAVVAWHNGIGPIPILMAGGAQSLMRNPAAGHGQGSTVDRTPLDAFVRNHLATLLMKMSPRDGVLENAAQTWCLADDQNDALLISSLEGPTITLAQPLPPRTYKGIWFEERTGNTQPLELPESWTKGTVLQKPGKGAWLLLLQTQP